MKKIILALATLALFSCNKDDDPVIVYDPAAEMYEKMKGWYELTEMYTETPVDVNYDGIPATNMIEEIDCLTGTQFVSYKTRIDTHNNFKEMRVDLAHTEYEPNTQIPTECFYTIDSSYDFIIDPVTGELDITWSFEEREADHGPLTYAKWEDNVLRLEYDKRFYTSEGWQTVKMHLTYVKLPADAD